MSLTGACVQRCACRSIGHLLSPYQWSPRRGSGLRRPTSCTCPCSPATACAIRPGRRRCTAYPAGQEAPRRRTTRRWQRRRVGRRRRVTKPYVDRLLRTNGELSSDKRASTVANRLARDGSRKLVMTAALVTMNERRGAVGGGVL